MGQIQVCFLLNIDFEGMLIATEYSDEMTFFSESGENEKIEIKKKKSENSSEYSQTWFRLWNLKYFYMSCLLHLNEDFHDDLLLDAIDQLAKESWK